MNLLSTMGTIVLDTHSITGFSDEEFFAFCMDNKDLKFERDANRNIYIMANTGGMTGQMNVEFSAEITIWNRKEKNGICFDSSTAFKLPNTAVRSPDAAWLKKESWDGLTEKEKGQFPPLCPDFIAEIKSPSDSLELLKAKMLEWVENGCLLALLINPEERLTYKYYKNNIQIISFDEIISGEEILKDFEVNLSTIINEI